MRKIFRFPGVPLLLLGAVLQVTAAPSLGAEQPPFPEEVLLENHLSAVRRAEHLPLLTRDPQADRTASVYAAALVRRGVLSHRDLRGGAAADRFSWTGRLVVLGEILGAAGRVEDLVPAWLASPGHRKVLLSSRWEAWGIGLAPAPSGWVAVVLFLEDLER